MANQGESNAKPPQRVPDIPSATAPRISTDTAMPKMISQSPIINRMRKQTTTQMPGKTQEELTVAVAFEEQ